MRLQVYQGLYRSSLTGPTADLWLVWFGPLLLGGWTDHKQSEPTEPGGSSWTARLNSSPAFSLFSFIQTVQPSPPLFHRGPSKSPISPDRFSIPAQPFPYFLCRIHRKHLNPKPQLRKHHRAPLGHRLIAHFFILSLANKKIYMCF